MAFKLVSWNIGFSISQQNADQPATATITARLPTSVNSAPQVLSTANQTVIQNFTPGQKTFIYITASPTEIAAIEGAVTVVPLSTESQ